MGIKSTVRSVESNKDDVKLFAYETAERLFEYFSASKGTELEVAKILTMDTFIRHLTQELDFLCACRDYNE